MAWTWGRMSRPLRRLLVDGHDEHGELAGAHEVAEDRRVVDEVGRRRVEQRLAEVEDAAALVARRSGRGGS